MSLNENGWDQLPREVRLRIDKVCDRFRESLQNRENPRIEDVLSAEPDLSSDELFCKLLEEEVSWRRQNALTLIQEDFGRRFPDKMNLIKNVFQHLAPTVSEQSTSQAASTSSGSGGPSRYRVLKSHLPGGLGEIFIAEDLELHREVALKEILKKYAADPDMRSRFLLEAEITGRLEHPGIVAVYGLGQYDDGRPYYAMRFIKGDDLEKVIKNFHDNPWRDPTDRTLAFRDMLGRFVDACNAVAFAHSRGILHRDLKPANIMLGKYGETLVLDWGLVKPLGRRGEASVETTLKPTVPNAGSQQGVVMGTPGFMSPEQADGQVDQLGPATDVYSLGATLYCLLTGKAPFQFETWTVMKERIMRGDFPKPSQLKAWIPRGLEAICLKAMALRPADRYESASALADEVERWLADERVKAWAEPWNVRLGRFLRHHRSQLAAAITVTLLALFNLSLIVPGVVGCLLCFVVVWPAWMILKRPFGRGISLGLTCALFAWMLPQTFLIGRFEEKMLDSFFCYRGERATTANVIIVSLDEDFLADLKKPLIYTSPEIAEIVTYAKQRGAASIGLDLIVPEKLAQLPDLQQGGVGDATKLGWAIRNARNVVLAEWKQKNAWLRPLPQWRFKELLEKSEPDGADIGFVNLTEDEDFFVRRQQLIGKEGGKRHLHFALAMAVRARGAKLEWNDARQKLFLDSKELPLDEEQRFRINFVGPRAFPMVPMSKVLAAARGTEPAPVNLDGAIVIMIATAPSQSDRHPTPYTTGYWNFFGGSLDMMPGGELHANILATIYDDAFILPAPSWMADLPMLLAFGVLLGIIFARLSPEVGCGIALLHHAIWLALGVFLFGWLHWQVPMAPMWLLGLLAYSVAIALRWRALQIA